MVFDVSRIKWMVYDVLQNIQKEKRRKELAPRIRTKNVVKNQFSDCKMCVCVCVCVCVYYIYIHMHIHIHIHTHPLFGKLISQATPRPVPEDSPLAALSTTGKFSKFLGGSTVSCSTGVESSLLGTTCTVVVEVVVAEGSWFILRPRLRSRAELA